MTIKEELAAFRRRIPECSIVAFADLSTGMVFAADTNGKVTQETLDDLCMSGAQSFSSRHAKVISEELWGNQTTNAQCSLDANPRRIHAYVKARPPAQEGLCCVLNDISVTQSVFLDAQDTLCRLTAED